MKLFSEFSKDNRRSSGITSLCIKCHTENNLKRYHSDPEKYRKWRTEHSEKISEYNHQYYSANKEKFAVTVENRRARIDGNGGNVTIEQWKTLKQQYQNTCIRCKRQEPEINLEQDHIIPLSLGGKHSIENIQPLCRSCNAKKRTKHIDYR